VSNPSVSSNFVEFETHHEVWLKPAAALVSYQCILLIVREDDFSANQSAIAGPFSPLENAPLSIAIYRAYRVQHTSKLRRFMLKK